MDKTKVMTHFFRRLRKIFKVTNLDDEIFYASELVVQAVNDRSKNRRERMLVAADALRRVMERQSIRIRDLVLALPPVQLLAYLWGSCYASILGNARRQSGGYALDKEQMQTHQFALEYIHAIWSCHAEFTDESKPLDEAKVAALMDVLNKFMHVAMHYCLTSSATRIKSDGSLQWADLEFQVKSGWVLMRGHRYQVLEKEFFSFVLKPHANALQMVYGMESDAIAAGVQEITDALRTGCSEASQKLLDGMDQAYALMKKTGESFSVATKKAIKNDNNLKARVEDACRDLFFGGICNLSRHTNFTFPLLEDISYLPGENTEFFAEGSFRGTPMRTLPALVKPGIKLGNEYYVTDGQLIRDSMYRAIQRGLLGRLPEYSEEWNRRQKILIEKSFPTIFSRQFAKASKYSEVFFKDPNTNQWVETDLVLVVDDVLLVVEAKAGVMAMHSPATDFDRHERVIRNLIVKAYKQCKRFIGYLSTDAEVLLYNKCDDGYAEIGRLRQASFRVILPIGLTIETYAPVSTMSKGLAELKPIHGKHPFISMSVDDLFVLNRFLPTTGELFHYLEVRQQVAGIPDVMLFDETDHLGAYIVDNRFNIRNVNQLKEAGRVVWDSMSDVVDRHFEGETWLTASVPKREYSKQLAAVLYALDKFRPLGWLEIDSYLRNLSDNEKSNLTTFFAQSKVALRNNPILRLLISDELPLQVWLCRSGIAPSSKAMRDEGELYCLAANVPRILALRISQNKKGRITDLTCASYWPTWAQV